MLVAGFERICLNAGLPVMGQWLGNFSVLFFLLRKLCPRETCRSPFSFTSVTFLLWPVPNLSFYSASSMCGIERVTRVLSSILLQPAEKILACFQEVPKCKYLTWWLFQDLILQWPLPLNADNSHTEFFAIRLTEILPSPILIPFFLI